MERDNTTLVNFTNAVWVMVNNGYSEEQCNEIVKRVYTAAAKAKAKAPKAEAKAKAPKAKAKAPKAEAKAPKAEAKAPKAEAKAPKAEAKAKAPKAEAKAKAPKAEVYEKYERFVVNMARRVLNCKDAEAVLELMKQKPQGCRSRTYWFFFQKDCRALAAAVATKNYKFKLVGEEENMVIGMIMTVSTQTSLETWEEEVQWMLDEKEKKISANDNSQIEQYVEPDVTEEEETATPNPNVTAARNFVVDALKYIRIQAGENVTKINAFLNGSYDGESGTIWDLILERINLMYNSREWDIECDQNGRILLWAIFAKSKDTLTQETFAKVAADPGKALREMYGKELIGDVQSGGFIHMYNALTAGKTAVRQD